MADTDLSASARAWFGKRDSDLRGARLLLAADRPEPDLAAYLSQQAAEKYLKGFLSSQNIDPPRTHNLIVLLDLATPYDRRLHTLREAARVLRPYAVDVRYPFADSPPDAEEAAEGLRHAGEVCETVRSCLSGDSDLPTG